MKKVLLGLLLIGSPALAQTQLVPGDTVKPAAKGAAARVADVCAPIGKTAKGELVYSMKCNDMPAPPSQAEAAPPRRCRAPSLKCAGAACSAGPMIAGRRPNSFGRNPPVRTGCNGYQERFAANHEKRSMTQLIVRAGDFTFNARFEEQLAPKTVAAFRKAMPFESQAIHVRWSGEGVWMPLGDLDFGVSYENHTSYPAPGQIILYPGGISETEILLAYGGVHFASKMGQLAGNHFITLTSGLENLAAFGKAVLWQGAQKIRFEEV